MARISFGPLPFREKNLMTAGVPMLLKSRKSPDKLPILCPFFCAMNFSSPLQLKQLDVGLQIRTIADVTE
jgi:hypothetical protein